MGDIMKANNQVAVVNYEEQAKKYLSLVGNNLPPKDATTFLELCKALELNPFKREIYCVPYQSKDGIQCNIITGYEVYLKRAERTGKLDGIEVSYGKLGNDTTCTVTIYRKDWSKPFKHTVLMSEYNTHKSVWESKPTTMLRKVAMSQAYRMVFPDEFGGMPYTKEEMDYETKVIQTEQGEVEILDDTKKQSESNRQEIINEIARLSQTKSVNPDVLANSYSKTSDKNTSLNELIDMLNWFKKQPNKQGVQDDKKNIEIF